MTQKALKRRLVVQSVAILDLGRVDEEKALAKAFVW